MHAYTISIPTTTSCLFKLLMSLRLLMVITDQRGGRPDHPM